MLERARYLGSRLLAASVCVCVGAAPLPVLAAPAEDGAEGIDTEKKAMEVYSKGKEAYDSGDYDEALQLFLEAQSLFPSPVFHYNIGLCHESLESFDQAIISFKAYLRSYESAYGEQPEDQVNTENKIARLEQAIEDKKAEEEAAADEEGLVAGLVQPVQDLEGALRKLGPRDVVFGPRDYCWLSGPGGRVLRQGLIRLEVIVGAVSYQLGYPGPHPFQNVFSPV